MRTTGTIVLAAIVLIGVAYFVNLPAAAALAGVLIITRLCLALANKLGSTVFAYATPVVLIGGGIWLFFAFGFEPVVGLAIVTLGAAVLMGTG